MPKENVEQGQLNIPSFLLKPLADARNAQAQEDALDYVDTDETHEDTEADVQSEPEVEAADEVVKDEVTSESDEEASADDEMESDDELDDGKASEGDGDSDSEREFEELEDVSEVDDELDAEGDEDGATGAGEDLDDENAEEELGEVESYDAVAEGDGLDEEDGIVEEEGPDDDEEVDAEEEPEEEQPAKEADESEDVSDSEVVSSPEDELDAMMKSVMRAVSVASANPQSLTDEELEELETTVGGLVKDQVQSLRDRIPDPTLIEQNGEKSAKDARPARNPKRKPRRRPNPASVSTQRSNRNAKPQAKATSESDAKTSASDESGAKVPVPTLEEDLETMRSVERRLFAHRYATLELDAFGASIDPQKATADRAEALAILAEEDHELLSAPDVEPALVRLAARSSELSPTVAAQVNVLTRDRNRLVRVPKTLNSQFVRLTAEAYDTWAKAREHNDWRSFAPYLDRLVNLKRKIAKAQNPHAHPYDTLLDEFEPGTDRGFYDSFFAQVKECVVPLLSAVSISGRTLSRACVEGRFDERRQWDVADDLCVIMGIDEDAHFLTSSEHPFSSAMTSNYAITATRVEYENLMGNIYTMLHELGHGLYEQGVDESLNRTSLKGGASYGMHEAQARFFENCVGRDRAFMVPLLELLRYRFPGQMGRVTPNQLYRAVNRVAPSLIRIDADELTYPLHILVRYEIEQLLLSGEAAAREVPKLWADRYESYVGIRPSDDTTGALQDVHWAMGEFGYFPTYALGNAYAAQLRAKMVEDGIEWDKSLRSADLAPIRAWLKERIWCHGRSKTAQELIQDACGEPFSAKYYTSYLTEKFSPLYSLRRA